jgi:hypothetical protein
MTERYVAAPAVLLLWHGVRPQTGPVLAALRDAQGGDAQTRDNGAAAPGPARTR